MNPFLVNILAGLKRSSWWLAVLMILGPVSAALGADDISLTYLTLSDGMTDHGYMDHEFVITNRSLTTPHEVRIQVGTVMTYGDHIDQLTRSVLVPPGASATIMLYQPGLPMQWDRVHVSVDGSPTNIDVGATAGSHMGGYYGGGRARVLISKAFGSSFVDKGGEAGVFDKAGGRATSSSTPSLDIGLVSDMTVETWPSEWLAYSRFDAVMLEGAEWGRLSSNAQDALVRYAELGGTIILKGDHSLAPAAWNQTLAKGKSNWIAVGFGMVGFEDWNTGSGNLDPTSDIWHDMARRWADTRAPLTRNRSTKDANDAFPVVEKISIPHKSLMALIVVFTLLVGPVNMLLLARSGRRIWLYWTIPSISIATSVLIFMFAMLSEGWYGEARTSGITLLDQSNDHASTIAWTAYYFPMTPSGGLRFSRDAELTIQAEENKWGAATGRRIDWTEVQHLTSGWISSRVPSHFIYRKSETRRERVVISQAADGTVSVQNSLGVNITALSLRTASGELFHAYAIPAGATVIAKSMAGDLLHRDQLPVTPLHRLFMLGDWFNLGENQKDLDNYAPVNGYAATLEGNPFVEDASDTLKRHRKSCLVIGINGPRITDGETVAPYTPPKPATTAPED